MIIRHVYSGTYQPTIFLTPNAPQLLAMQWMAYTDTRRFPLEALQLLLSEEPVEGEEGASDTITTTGSSSSGNNNNNDDDFHQRSTKHAIRQRYALMTLFFSNRMDSASSSIVLMVDLLRIRVADYGLVLDLGICVVKVKRDCPTSSNQPD